jgi:hypothetical protein
VWVYGGEVPAAFWASLWLLWIEMAVVCATALLFSTLTGPVLAAAYAGAVVIAGHLSDDLTSLATRAGEKGGVLGPELLRLAYWVLPDLQALSLRTQAANALPVPPDFLSSATLYGGAYAVCAVVVAAWIFSRRAAL